MIGSDEALLLYEVELSCRAVSLFLMHASYPYWKRADKNYQVAHKMYVTQSLTTKHPFDININNNISNNKETRANTNTQNKSTSPHLFSPHRLI